jgi:hypothetical protein
LTQHYLALDQPKWYRDDFSSEDKLTGTIFTNQSYTVKKNLTGYTLKVRMNKNYRWGDHFNKTATIVTAADGTWSYAVNQNEMPPPGIYNVKLELSKSGVKISTLNRVELLILEGPSA